MLYIEPRDHAPKWLINVANNRKAKFYGYIRIYPEDVADRNPVLRDRTPLMISAMRGLLADLAAEGKPVDPSAEVKYVDYKGFELQGRGFNIAGANLNHDYRIFSI